MRQFEINSKPDGDQQQEQQLQQQPVVDNEGRFKAFVDGLVAIITDLPEK